MLERLRIGLGLGLAMALGETLAALAVPDRELGLFLTQGVIAVLVGAALALAPVPLRALPIVPILAVGAFHAASALREPRDRLAEADVVLVVVHLLVLGTVAWRWIGPRGADTLDWRRRALLRGAAAYVAQALACALLLLPSTHTEPWVVRAMALPAATLAPILALGSVRAAERARRAWTRGAWVLAGLVVLAGLPWFARGAWRWVAHQQVAPTWALPARHGADVILIVMDTVRADRTSLLGHARPTTPELERFARRATVYERAQSQGIWTLPGHASLFTGLYPSEHGADWTWGSATCHPLSPQASTLAERFASRGYLSASVAANRNMFTRAFGLTQGFHWSWAERPASAKLWIPAASMQLVHLCAGETARRKIGSLERNPSAHATEINASALEWLDRTQGRGPRFLFLNYMDAHDQVRRVPCAAPVFGTGRSFEPHDVTDSAAIVDGQRELAQEERTLLLDWYDTQVACLDLHLGALLDALDERGLLDPALIAITSDHGHLLGEHSAFAHRTEAWEELTHVPLVLKLPGQRTGSRCAEDVETADLSHALLELAQLQPSESGASAPCPLDPEARVVVSESPLRPDEAALHPSRYGVGWTAFVDGATKFYVSSAGTMRVADLAPQVQEILREPTAEERARARALLDAWRAGLAIPPWHPALGAKPQSEGAEERLRRLQDQGYVGR
jgi:arylsulfatase A-like enzyme